MEEVPESAPFISHPSSVTLHTGRASRSFLHTRRPTRASALLEPIPLLGVDYAKDPDCIADAYQKQREIGFVPYVSVEALDRVVVE